METLHKEFLRAWWAASFNKKKKKVLLIALGNHGFKSLIRREAIEFLYLLIFHIK